MANHVFRDRDTNHAKEKYKIEDTCLQLTDVKNEKKEAAKVC